MRPRPTAPLLLITIAISHFCEKARWALDRTGLPYREEPHAPMLHYPFTLLRGGGRTVPVLVTDDGVLADSTDILDYVDAFAAPGTGLYPSGDAQRTVRELEERFDTELGPQTRLWGYFHLLPDGALALRTLAAHLPVAERLMLPWLFPSARAVMRQGMGISRPCAEQALERVGKTFNDVETLLADGRRYLVGDRFSAADLTFAALATPVLAPVEYGGALPALDELPVEMQSVIQEFRARPGGRFALRMFREERRHRTACASADETAIS